MNQDIFKLYPRLSLNRKHNKKLTINIITEISIKRNGKWHDYVCKFLLKTKDNAMCNLEVAKTHYGLRKGLDVGGDAFSLIFEPLLAYFLSLT